MGRATPLRPSGYGQHGAISGVATPRRSYGYDVGAAPWISRRGARNAGTWTSTTGCYGILGLGARFPDVYVCAEAMTIR